MDCWNVPGVPPDKELRRPDHVVDLVNFSGTLTIAVRLPLEEIAASVSRSRPSKKGKGSSLTIKQKLDKVFREASGRDRQFVNIYD